MGMVATEKIKLNGNKKSLKGRASRDPAFLYRVPVMCGRVPGAKWGPGVVSPNAVTEDSGACSEHWALVQE